MSRHLVGSIAGPTVKSVVGIAVLASVGLAGGCASTDLDDVSYRSVSRNLTPELMGMTERPVDIDRNMRMNFNQDLRAMWGDLGRAMHTDRPSALSPFRAISTSGQPR